MTDLKPMTDDELVQLCDQLIKDATSTDDTSATRQYNLDRYLGEAYGDERLGSSSVRTREVFEAIEWTLASLMRVFSAGEKPVSFDPVGPEDEQAAEQETEYLSHVVLKENKAYMALHAWFKDALMYPNGYIKVWWDADKKVSTHTFERIHETEVAALVEDPNVELISQDIVDQATEGAYYRIEAKLYTPAGRVRFAPVPPDEMIIHDQHTEVDLDGCAFTCHRRTVRLTDLIKMGYPKDVVFSLPADDEDLEFADERANRDEDDIWGTDDENADPAMREVVFEEAYLLVDRDGDGVAELRKIAKVRQTLLEADETDFIPFVAICAIPMPHKHQGLSWADALEDLQRINTVLTRQMLNNLYRSNNPRPVIGRGVSMEDVLNDAPNYPIRAQDVSQIRMEPIAPVIGQVLPALEHFKQAGQTRVGVSEHTMGLSPEVLAQSTKGAAMLGFEQANGRLEMLARNFAEGVKTLFLKVHQLLRDYSDINKQVRLSGGWVPVNPNEWRRREDMTINVGIGNATKEQKLVSARMIMETQEKMVMAGGMGVTVSPQNVYNAAALMTEAAGHTDPERYFMDPDTATQPQQKGPSPEEQLLQIQAQAEQAKAQLEAQKLQLQAQKQRHDEVTAERQYIIEQQRIALEIQRVNLQAEIERAKLNKDDDTGATRIEEARIKAQAELEKARIEAEARFAELSAQTASQPARMPDVHIHQGGKKRISVVRTPTGLEGLAEDIDDIPETTE